MSRDNFESYVIESLSSIGREQAALTAQVTRLADAVDGNPGHGVPGLMERMGVLEERSPSRVKSAGTNAIAGLIGGALTLAATILKGVPGG